MAFSDIKALATIDLPCARIRPNVCLETFIILAAAPWFIPSTSTRRMASIHSTGNCLVDIPDGRLRDGI
jgi:hypothetical protein